jgi:thiol-disulfide isomerase/thioredoxin
LPSDWLHGGFTHMAIAQDIVYAENSTISFELPDLEGRKVSLGDERFRDKGVIVNVTGSWCGGCKLEAPYLAEFYKKYKYEGLEIIGVAFEKGGGQDGLEAAKSFKEKYGINYTMLYGGSTDTKHVESVIKGLKCFRGYPTTIYIDRKGKVRYMHTGFWILTEPHKKWQLELIEEHIKMILAEDAGDKQGHGK